MKVKALDQLHVSSVRADTIRKDEVFEVSEPVGKKLVERGLVKRVGAQPAAKRAAKPENKKAAEPANKAG